MKILIYFFENCQKMYKDVKNQGQIWKQHYQIMNEKLESPKMTHPIAHTPKETRTPLLWGELACLLLSPSEGNNNNLIGCLKKKKKIPVTSPAWQWHPGQHFDDTLLKLTMTLPTRMTMRPTTILPACLHSVVVLSRRHHSTMTTKQQLRWQHYDVTIAPNDAD